MQHQDVAPNSPGRRLLRAPADLYAMLAALKVRSGTGNKGGLGLTPLETKKAANWSDL
jgi:hypothetical protein